MWTEPGTAVSDVAHNPHDEREHNRRHPAWVAGGGDDTRDSRARETRGSRALDGRTARAATHWSVFSVIGGRALEIAALAVAATLEAISIEDFSSRGVFTGEKKNGGVAS